LSPRKSRNRDLSIGDLVTHALYGKEWIGIIIEFENDSEAKGLSKKKALVQMQPGTKHDGLFDPRSVHHMVHKNLGYGSIHWLFKIEVKNGDTGSSRNKTPPG
jgi:hypothetical protein